MAFACHTCVCARDTALGPVSAISAMASQPAPYGAGNALNALQFRVMRLPRPTLELETPLRFAPEDLFGACEAEASLPNQTSGGSFEHRLDLFNAADASGLTGALVLPQSFGVVHLGETFASLVSVANHTDLCKKQVVVQVELQTQRRRVMLFDNTAAPLPAIEPGASYDFIVEHDLKELGAHTLACTVAYSEDVPGGAPGDNRRRHPQHFKFTVENPIAVRTKVRPGRDGSTLLEACVENATKTPLLLSSATFEPSPQFTCHAIVPPKSTGADGCAIPNAGGVGLPSLAGRDLIVLDASGGSEHFLFELSERADLFERGGDVASPSAGVALGKLEIRWRGRMGETGRLQTQQILGAPRVDTGGDVELSIDPDTKPAAVSLTTPFALTFVAVNVHATQTSETLELVVLDDDDEFGETLGESGGAGEVGRSGVTENGSISGTGSGEGGHGLGGADGGLVLQDTSPGIVLDGARAISLGAVAPGQTATAVVTFVPLLPGARRTPNVAVRECVGGRTVGYMRGVEFMVGRL